MLEKTGSWAGLESIVLEEGYRQGFCGLGVSEFRFLGFRMYSKVEVRGGAP